MTTVEVDFNIKCKFVSESCMISVKAKQTHDLEKIIHCKPVVCKGNTKNTCGRIVSLQKISIAGLKSKPEFP